MKKRKFKSQKVREQDIERVRVNFGRRTRNRAEVDDDVPVHDRGRRNKPFKPDGLDDYDDRDDDELVDAIRNGRD